MIDPLFAACALVSVVSALMVVTRKNPVYSALWLMQAFLAFAVIFFDLGATFVGAMHIMVYTGAILVLFLFVIMLLNLKGEELGSELPKPHKAVMIVLAGMFALALGAAARDQAGVDRVTAEAGITVAAKRPMPPVEITFPDKSKQTVDWGGVKHVGWELFTNYVFPFEIVSVLIMVAIFGGVVLAKKNL